MHTALQRQGVRPYHVAQAELSIEMREPVAAARDLPFQIIAHGRGITGQQGQAGFFGKMPGRGFCYLICCGKMDEPIGDIHGRTVGCACGLKASPFVGPKYFVYAHGPLMPCEGGRIKPDFPL